MKNKVELLLEILKYCFIFFIVISIMTTCADMSSMDRDKNEFDWNNEDNLRDFMEWRSKNIK